MVRLIHVTTVPLSLWNFFHGQTGYMASRGYDVAAVSSPDELLDRFAARENVAVHPVEMMRSIAPLKDLTSLSRLRAKFRELRPDIVHAHTPKGGLLGMMAARWAGVPVCIYHVHGLPFVSQTGLQRQILRWSDWFACSLAHQVICVSPSLREVVVGERICPPEKVKVLAGGSINGVDADGKYNPANYDPESRAALRAGHGIPRDARVIGFVGRIVRDKGIVELTRAWSSLRERFADLHLMLVGPVEPRDPVPAEILTELRNDPRVHFTGQVDDLPGIYAVLDIVALPSYREGLPVVPLEASSMGVPVVATRIPGCVDGIRDGETGVLVPLRDVPALTEALAAYLLDPELRHRHGQAGREWMRRDFRPEVVWAALDAEYRRLLLRRRIRPPEPPQPAQP